MDDIPTIKGADAAVDFENDSSDKR